MFCYEADRGMIIKNSFTTLLYTIHSREDVCLSCTALSCPLTCTAQLCRGSIPLWWWWRFTHQIFDLIISKCSRDLTVSTGGCQPVNGKIMLQISTKIKQNMQIVTKTKTNWATDDNIFYILPTMVSAHVCHKKDGDVNFFCVFQVSLSNKDLCRTACSV